MLLPQHTQPLPIIDGDSLKKARTEKNLTTGYSIVNKYLKKDYITTTYVIGSIKRSIQ
jgi:hypothetical protein